MTRPYMSRICLGAQLDNELISGHLGHYDRCLGGSNQAEADLALSVESVCAAPGCLLRSAL